MNTPLRILITGVGGPAGVNAARLLSKIDGIETHGCDITEHAVGQKFVSSFSLVEPVKDADAYLRSMRALVAEKDITHLIPTVAEELVLMESLAAALKEDGRSTEILVSPHETVALCDEKDKLYDWMRAEFPEYMGQYQRLTAVPSWKADSYFIKPVKGRGSRGCREVSAAELAWLVSNTDMTGFIAMEVLPGTEWTVDAYFHDDGSEGYIVPRVRVGLSGGISSVGRTDRNDDLISMTRAVFAKLPARGPVFIQWKLDAAGKPKLVEINPRLSGGVTITAAAGADPMKMFVEAARGTRARADDWREVTVARYFEDVVLP